MFESFTGVLDSASDLYSNMNKTKNSMQEGLNTLGSTEFV